MLDAHYMWGYNEKHNGNTKIKLKGGNAEKGKL